MTGNPGTSTFTTADSATPLVLIVEDEPALADALRLNIERQHMRAVVLSNGLDAVQQFQSIAPDLLILDVMLPGLDGLEVCRRIRQISNVPVLMLTARGEEIDRVLGLELGADDYLTKPFSLRELLARVRALLRRAQVSMPVEREEYVNGDLRVSLREHRVMRGDAEVHLRPQEFALLAYLVRNRGLALSRQQLLTGAWGDAFSGDERTVDVHVRGLREAIEADASAPTRLVTVRGIGYRFDG